MRKKEYIDNSRINLGNAKANSVVKHSFTLPKSNSDIKNVRALSDDAEVKYNKLSRQVDVTWNVGELSNGLVRGSKTLTIYVQYENKHVDYKVLYILIDKK